MNRLPLLLTCLAAGLLLGADCAPTHPDRTSVAPTSRSDNPDDEAFTDAEVTLPAQTHRGVCLAHNWQNGGANGYGSTVGQKTLDHVAQLGSDAVSLTPFGWMSDLESPTIKGEHNAEIPDGAEDRYSLERVIDQSNARGLHVVLKPHLWIRGGAWRGEIAPVGPDGEPAWDTWWSDYRDFILHYADIAAAHEVDELVVGTELESAIDARPDAFLATIEAVEERYAGHLTYGANWNEEVPDRIWKRLDSVGVQFYPPLTDERSPSLEAMRRALRDHLDDWRGVARRVDRPLTLTEVGYKSVVGAVEKPYGWPQDLPADRRTPDQPLQAKAYRALFAELGRLERLRGVYIWKYFTDPDRDEGGAVGFSPRAKQAEAILERAYRPTP